MRSFVLAVSKWFPNLTQPTEIVVDQNQPSSSDTDEDDTNENVTDEHFRKRLERVREKFDREKQKYLEEVENQNVIRNDNKPEPPPLIRCVYKILERYNSFIRINLDLFLCLEFNIFIIRRFLILVNCFLISSAMRFVLFKLSRISCCR